MTRRITRAADDIDFADEDAVLAEIARALDIDPDELRIREERGLSGFGAGTVYEISIRGGHKEWNVVENEDQEQELALAVVKQDLDQEPELFTKDFIGSHINTERLRRDLHNDVLGMRIDDLLQLDKEDFWREWEREGFESPEEDDDGELPEPENHEVEELAERQTEEQLRDPMEYLEDIYGDEAAAKAIEIAGIDIDAAADEAVSTDGPAHFLARYDGNSYTTRSGLVYWRAN
jgi:hypothetical protein